MSVWVWCSAQSFWITLWDIRKLVNEASKTPYTKTDKYWNTQRWRTAHAQEQAQSGTVVKRSRNCKAIATMTVHNKNADQCEYAYQRQHSRSERYWSLAKAKSGIACNSIILIPWTIPREGTKLVRMSFFRVQVLTCSRVSCHVCPSHVPRYTRLWSSQQSWEPGLHTRWWPACLQPRPLSPHPETSSDCPS